ncbi:MAG: hypothetical protein A3D96_04410 [Chlamydiae bacterium RIFCSPHIGHO2_12_FULL_44_59]|nr:MAG: hypothetical protein A2796_04185 [Chlamydiae bacterium RIFCSPHIGHO2_01_FULL_44_39]OGN56472.1 MAG: hypothetical protein A3C42_02250 [Chlamydiae bacterium RIFCSPHIGHO2_02_FULL_45_9]OGN60331.1 MAG: hypothetical protein A3D96_04410 [Chlamydiae bacterium RIFCSPHIGHO2_12_FULL_44_59]OGN66314.1 MAG: hypothetical protein A2978_01855 [Chlamydiae bacterium RIFCSPLOWO2_01_FULL_44_52]OGN69265.1 MAG: hypothetical protein A3I67_00715 [Chlamydiae bacterium RIFCSPLOWO2_02_FULL_45_22]OGN70205.1 MAG: hyp
MLQQHLEKLCKELEIKTPKLSEKNLFLFAVANETVELKDLDPGVALHARIYELPKKKKEELFIHLMRANLLGQGTGNARIGLDKDEKFLTLSLGLPYEMNYQTFKESVEDFINYLLFWRDEVVKFQNEESVY